LILIKQRCLTCTQYLFFWNIPNFEYTITCLFADILSQKYDLETERLSTLKTGKPKVSIALLTQHCHESLDGSYVANKRHYVGFHRHIAANRISESQRVRHVTFGNRKCCVINIARFLVYLRDYRADLFFINNKNKVGH